MLPPLQYPFNSSSLTFPYTTVSLCCKNNEAKFINFIPAISNNETSLPAILSPLLPSFPQQQQLPISSPLFWEAQCSPENFIFLHQLKVVINCFCHIELLNAQFEITHNEQTNDFFVELLPTNEGRFVAVPLLCALFRFLPNEPEHFQIFSSSYGHWSSFGSVQRCSPLKTTFFGESEAVEEKEIIRLDVHVFEQFFSIELNGKEIERHKHIKNFFAATDEKEN